MKQLRSRTEDGRRTIALYPQWNMAVEGYERYVIERLCLGWWIASWKMHKGFEKGNITWIPGTLRSCLHTCRQHQAARAMEALR